MLNVGQLNEGFVLDHIEAGKSMMIYNNLGLGELDCQVAIIKNARSSKMGRKDIIKIEGGLDLVDLDVLGFIDHNITVNIIKDGQIVDKKSLSLPKLPSFLRLPENCLGKDGFPHCDFIHSPWRYSHAFHGDYG